MEIRQEYNRKNVTVGNENETAGNIEAKARPTDSRSQDRSRPK